jgi:leucyl aminopeptidase
VPLAVHLADSIPSQATAIGLPVFADRLDSTGIDPARLKRAGFEGKAEQVSVQSDQAGDDPTLVLVGLGDAEGLSTTALRRAAAAFGRAVRRHNAVALRLDPLVSGAEGPGLAPMAAAQAATEGLRLGLYEYLAHKSKPSPSALGTVWLSGAGADAEAGLERGITVAESVRWARDLVNEPGGSLTPASLAKAAADLGEAAGLTVKVRGRKAIRAMGLGGLLGVNRGSSRPPRFIELRWRPPGERSGRLALVGKGITFDSGGLSLKSGTGMMGMKTDMAGAAAVMAATAAAARLGLDVEIRCYVPATDNMTGPDATRPGDVLRLRNGKTIEVLNTDAEGRLILADGLAVASEAHPDAIVDVATLTGACKVALGSKVAGVMGNDDTWLTQIEAASKASGEAVWRLPLPAEYRKAVESSVADMKNIGGGDAGALVAGLILQEFVGDGIPWAHLDIAGTASSDADDGDLTKGATGFATRLLVELAERFERPGRPHEVSKR